MEIYYYHDLSLTICGYSQGFESSTFRKGDFLLQGFKNIIKTTTFFTNNNTMGLTSITIF